MTRVSPEEADRNAAALIAYGVVGRDSLKKLPPDKLSYGTSDAQLRAELSRVRKLAGKQGLSIRFGNIDTLSKMRRIATEYTEDQIRDLAHAVRQHQSRFSISQLVRLLVIADRTRRDKIATKAIAQSWPLERLNRTVQVARKARRAGAGRKPVIPTSQDQRLIVLEGLCTKWSRWTAAARSQLPEELVPLIAQTDRAIDSVRRKTAVLLKRPEPREKAANP